MADERTATQAENWDVIVAGAGFAGVAAARLLGKRGVRVLLVDAHDYHQFQPLLYQVATSQIGISEVARPLRSIFRRIPSVRVAVAEVVGVDPAARAVTLDDGTVCTADRLVVAMGAKANFFGIEGVAENSFPLYSLGDAVRLGTRLLALLDDADRIAAPRRDIDLVVVGGGPTGVEFAGAAAENVETAVAAMFHRDLASRVRVHLVDMVPTVLGPFTEKSQQYAISELHRSGVRMHLGKGVTKAEPGRVLLDDGTEIPADVLVWAGGLAGRDVLRDTGLPLGRGGRVDVDSTMAVEGYDGVYALGDAANMVDADGSPLPQLASVAQQAGTWLARNILSELAGGPRAPFRYLDKGIMAMIGRGAAVAELGRRRTRIHGFPAFAAWLGVHAALLPGAWQRMGAVAAWGVGYLTKDRPQAMTAHLGQDLALRQDLVPRQDSEEGSAG